jgi:hypothetical protein
MYFSKAVKNLFKIEDASENMVLYKEDWDKGTISFYCPTSIKIDSDILADMQRIFGTVELEVVPSILNFKAGHNEIKISNVKFPKQPT